MRPAGRIAHCNTGTSRLSSTTTSRFLPRRNRTWNPIPRQRHTAVTGGSPARPPTPPIPHPIGVYRSTAAACPASTDLLPQQEGRHRALESPFRFDHRPVAAVGEHVQLGVGDGPHRNHRHIQRTHSVVAPPGDQRRRLNAVHHGPRLRSLGGLHHLHHRGKRFLAV